MIWRACNGHRGKRSERIIGRSALRLVPAAGAAALPGGSFFATARVPADDVAMATRLEDAGFRMIDAGLTFDVDAVAARDGGSGARDAAPGDRAAVATIARDGGGEEARAEILKRWGRAGLVSLAYAILAAQAFPTFKYAIGHGNACVRLRIGGETVAMQQPQYA